MTKVFIDGKEGTTGLKIFERMQSRDDVKLIVLDEQLRKNAQVRKEALNSCDVAFLCLPDEISKESVGLVGNDNTVIIDASTAHRTQFTYGLPELSQVHREAIVNSKRIAVPGCHASGYCAIVYPLMEAGVLNDKSEISCVSLTGYSGGGKSMIKEYEAEHSDNLLSPAVYALSQTHKHLPEMRHITGTDPVFIPVVADYYSGMNVTVSFFSSEIEKIKNIYKQKYNGIICYKELDGNFLYSNSLSGMDSMEIYVAGDEKKVTVSAIFDNLGKGASGAAVQCFNLVTQQDESKGLLL